MEENELRAQLEAHHQDCYGWALHCANDDRSQAEDVLQTAYWKLLSGKARFHGKSTFKTWIFGVIRICAAEERRRRWWRNLWLTRLHETTTTPNPMELPEAALDSDRTTQVIQVALDLLPPRQREILHLVFFQGLTLEESARVMDISLGSARQHYHRAKQRMRKELKSQSL